MSMIARLYRSEPSNLHFCHHIAPLTHEAQPAGYDHLLDDQAQAHKKLQLAGTHLLADPMCDIFLSEKACQPLRKPSAHRE